LGRAVTCWSARWEPSFEAELARIYERARTIEEVNAEIRALREKVAEERKRFEETRSRTIGIIEQRFDEDVQQVFRLRRDAVPGSLAELDRDLSHVVLEFLRAKQIAFTQKDGVVEVSAGPKFPEGVTVAIGAVEGHTSLHLGHPLVATAVDDARQYTGGGAVAAKLKAPAKSGRLRLLKASFDGFERVELIIPVVAFADGQVLEQAAALELLAQELKDAKAPAQRVDDATMQDAQDQALFVLQTDVDSAEHRRFEAASLQAERFLDDRLLVLRKRKRTIEDRIDSAERRREGAVGSEARTDAEHALKTATRDLELVDGRIAKLQQRDDQRYRTYLEHIQKRRYSPPRIEVLVDVDVVFT
jgi:hypothetical protein